MHNFVGGNIARNDIYTQITNSLNFHSIPMKWPFHEPKSTLV